jgi:hypothetical protein
MGAKMQHPACVVPQRGPFLLVATIKNCCGGVLARRRELRLRHTRPRRAGQLRMLASLSKYNKRGDREFWIKAAR